MHDNDPKQSSGTALNHGVDSVLRKFQRYKVCFQDRKRKKKDEFREAVQFNEKTVAIWATLNQKRTT